MKKDYEEIEELDDDIIDDDEIIDDEVIDDVEDEPVKAKKAPKKATAKKSAKKSHKGAIIGSSVAIGVIAIALVAIFVVLPLFGIDVVIIRPKDVPTMDMSELYYDTETGVGLYFYGPNHTILNGQSEDNADMVRASTNISTDYFDPSKPTIIWTHGWEPTGSFGDRYLCAGGDTRKVLPDYDVNYAQELRKMGYNVGTLQYQGDLKTTKNYATQLAKIYSYCVDDFNETGYSLSYMFASELATVLGDKYKKDLILVGHSCGGFMSTATAYMLEVFYYNKLITNRHLIPKRLILQDPYVVTLGDKLNEGTYLCGTYEEVGDRTKCQVVQDMLISLDSHRKVAIEVYIGMTGAGSGFIDDSKGYFTKVKDHVVTIDMTGMKEWQGCVGNIHVLTRDWVWASLIGKSLYDQDGKLAPTSSCTYKEIRKMRGGLYQQTLNGFYWKDTTQTEVLKKVNDTSGFKLK